MTTNENTAAVRVCAIADIECSRGCGTGECKREREARYPDLQPAAAPIDSVEELRDKWKLVNGDMREGEHGLITYHVEAFDEGLRVGGSKPAPSPTDERAAISEHDAKGLEIIAGWLDKEGLVEPATMLRRLASARASSANETGAEGATERDLTRTIDERDRAEEDGTRLAEAVGEFLGVDVGEWSSANNPILSAIEAIESRSPLK